jgi:hypothetical protein
MARQLLLRHRVLTRRAGAANQGAISMKTFKSKAVVKS